MAQSSANNRGNSRKTALPNETIWENHPFNGRNGELMTKITKGSKTRGTNTGHYRTP